MLLVEFDIDILNYPAHTSYNPVKTTCAIYVIVVITISREYGLPPLYNSIYICRVL